MRSGLLVQMGWLTALRIQANGVRATRGPESETPEEQAQAQDQGAQARSFTGPPGDYGADSDRDNAAIVPVSPDMFDLRLDLADSPSAWQLLARQRGGDGQHRALPEVALAPGGPSLARCSKVTDSEQPAPPSASDRRPKLLADLCSSDAGLLGDSICVVQEGGRGRRLEGGSAGAVAAELWPGRERPDHMWRGLRMLSDTSKRDFLLHPTWWGYLVRADFVRAAVEPHQAVFVCAQGRAFELFLEELLERAERESFEEGGSFSSWVVECIVCAAVTVRTLRLQALRSVADEVLGGISLQSPDSTLRLYPLKLAISSFVEQMKPLKRGLRDALQHHTSLRQRAEAAEGGLERNKSSGSMVSGGSQSSVPVIPGELEDALHNWQHSAEEVLADALDVSTRIADSMRFVEASMSCTRNRLIMFELWTAILTNVIGAGALISSIFGVNLSMGFETEPGIFNLVVLSIVGIGALTLVVSLHKVTRSQKHYLTTAPCSGTTGSSDASRRDDEYVLSLCADRAPDGSPPSVRLEKVALELREPALPAGAGGPRCPGPRRLSAASPASRAPRGAFGAPSAPQPRPSARRGGCSE
ncbi:unnamed protein product [Prorocentrum cordatum]|uniref:Magnesium transporter n=1 Tax=Prorocentrum cordatum TaxID=2364126 RepID=A0ABN9QUJ8_9DINO|nr:unnamed protein product [Polarella glacialis]